MAAAKDNNKDILQFRFSRIEERLLAIEEGIRMLQEQNIGRREFSDYQKDVDRRLNSLEDNNKWVVRAVLGVVIGVVLAIAFKS